MPARTARLNGPFVRVERAVIAIDEIIVVTQFAAIYAKYAPRASINSYINERSSPFLYRVCHPRESAVPR